MRPWLFFSVVFAFAALPAACSDTKDVKATDMGNVAATPPPAPEISALTFWGDIAPIFNAKCVKCHQAGGIAPFALDAYAPARAKAPLIATATNAGTMPPYLVTHDGSCGDFEAGETLTPLEKAKIWEWAGADRKAGEPVTLTRPPRAGLGPTGADIKEWRTPEIAPVAQGGQLARHDEYRCFLVDPGLDRDRFITGYEIIPGTPALVHHLIAFLIDPDRPGRAGRTNGEIMSALDAADPDRPGWPCFGMAGEGIDEDALPAIWAPGQGPVTYPQSVGVLQTKSHKLVVQLHYNLSDPDTRGMSDTTTIRLRYADSVPRRAVFIAEDALLDTAFLPKPDTLPPGQKSVKRTWKRSLSGLGFGHVPHLDLLGVMPHMHERGVRKQIRLTSEGAPETCAADVPRWDFHWQKMYFYKTAPRLDPQTVVELECEYDTSKDTTPITPGWGTRNEMCTAILMLALPEGM
jgi:Copper type II ascorbate-dependent monooxygenase, C-terminal domain